MTTKPIMVRRPTPTNGDPDPGTFLADEPSGIVHARTLGSLTFAEANQVAVIRRGHVIMNAPAGTSAEQLAYARLNGRIYPEAGDGWNKLIGQWVTDRDAHGLATLSFNMDLEQPEGATAQTVTLSHPE